MLENLLRNNVDKPILTLKQGGRERREGDREKKTCNKTKTGKNALQLNKFDF